MTTPLERMEAIMASLVQERSQMNTRNAPINKLNANVSCNDAPKLTKSQSRKRRETLMKILTADLGSLKKALETTTGNISLGTNAKGDLSEVASGIDALKLTISQSRKRRETLMKILTADLGSLKKALQNTTGNTSSGTNAKGDLSEVASGSDALKLTISQSRKRRETLMKILTADLGSLKKALETTTGNTSSGTSATDNTVSKKRNRKKMNNNNPDLGDTLSACESTPEGFGMTKVIEGTCDETVASKTKTLAKVLNPWYPQSLDLDNKRPTLTKILNLRYPQSLDLDKKQPTLAEISNSRYPQSLEASKGETGSGTTSTDKPASKKQKRQKLNKNPDLGDTLSTRESTHEGLSTTKVLEPKTHEMISAKTATPDANMVPKEQVHTEVVSDRTGESEATNNGNDPPMLTKSQKKNRRKDLKKKLYANLGFLERREDAENPNSIGASATVDNKTSMSTPAGTTYLNGKVEVQKKMETSSGTSATVDHKTSMSSPAGTMNFNVKFEVHKKMETSSVTSAIVDNKTSMSCPAGTTNLIGKGEVQKKLETSSGTTVTDNTTLKKRKREKLKNNDPDSGDNNHESTQEGLCTTKVPELKSAETVSAKTATPDANMVSDADHSEVANGKTGKGFSTKESTQEALRTAKILELKSDETVSVKTATPDANMVSKENHSEVSIGKTGEGFSTKESTQEVLCIAKILELKSDETVSVKTATPDANMASKENHSEVSIGKTGEGLNTIESTQEGSSTTRVLELKKDETISAKTPTPDANMVAKEQVQTEVANGRTGESEMKNNGNNPPMLTQSQKKNRRKALKKKWYPDSVDTSATVDNKTSMSSPAGTTNLNGNVEVQKEMVTSSSTNASDNTTLKRIKRGKMENNNPDSGDNLSTHESTQEGLGTTKVLEVKGDETVLAITATIDANVASKDHSEAANGETGESETANLKLLAITAIIDANMMSKEDHSEVANGETGESETTNLNLSGKEKRKSKPKSNDKQPTLGEIFGPVY